MKLVIASTSIRQDADGRFSLNDLHSASGGDPNQQPAFFLRNDQTQKLIAAIDAESNSANSQSSTVQISAVKTKEGRGGGTHVAKEMVYAYAMWISPEFHLQVIRTFDEVATGRAALPNPPRLFPDYFKVARLIGLDKNAAATSANQAVRKLTGVNLLELLDQTHMVADPRGRTLNATQLAAVLGYAGGAREVNHALEKIEMQRKFGGEWAPTEEGRQHGEWYDTGKRHGDGVPVKQWKWFESVGLPLAQQYLPDPA